MESSRIMLLVTTAITNARGRADIPNKTLLFRFAARGGAAIWRA